LSESLFKAKIKKKLSLTRPKIAKLNGVCLIVFVYYLLVLYCCMSFSFFLNYVVQHIGQPLWFYGAL